MNRIDTRTGNGMGWIDYLRSNYENSFSCWKNYAEMYGLHHKLGFQTIEEAWEANPLIQGSCNPDDFAKIENGKAVFID